ncbi:hypothetical protein GQ600_24958 [Phytophthora cactorum]|nr:hypothetical protein GQ600_17319 [Phytophthora cactorum]KAF1791172.1 hypothetical protein GQ600_24958 [Phytophthora cactorum]
MKNTTAFATDTVVFNHAVLLVFVIQRPKLLLHLRRVEHNFVEADVTLLRSHVTCSLHSQQCESFLHVVDSNNDRHRLGSTSAGKKHAGS